MVPQRSTLPVPDRPLWSAADDRSGRVWVFRVSLRGVSEAVTTAHEPLQRAPDQALRAGAGARNLCFFITPANANALSARGSPPTGGAQVAAVNR